MLLEKKGFGEKRTFNILPIRFQEQLPTRVPQNCWAAKPQVRVSEVVLSHQLKAGVIPGMICDVTSVLEG